MTWLVIAVWGVLHGGYRDLSRGDRFTEKVEEHRNNKWVISVTVG